MPYGTIMRWNPDRGFGFINDDQDPRKNWSFVHISSVDGEPEEGDSFTYDLEPGRDGRTKAHNLKPLTPAIEECDRVFGYDDF